MKRSSLLILFSLITLIMQSIFFMPVKQGIVRAETVSVEVNVDILNVRSGPGLQYDIAGKVKRGQRFTVHQQKGDWYQIEFDEGYFGWVAGWLVTASQAGIRAVESTVDILNVRSGPSQSFAVIDQISPGKLYPIVSEEGNWVKIRINQDREGWVAGWLIKKKQADADDVDMSSSNRAVVRVPILNVRSGPGTNFAKIGQIKNGEEVQVEQVKDGWYQIKFSGREGWISGDFATLGGNGNGGNGAGGGVNRGEPLDQQPKVRILNEGTNIRSGPGTHFEVVTRAGQGDEFTIIDTDGKWYKIKIPDGRTAYVAGWIVATSGLAGTTDESSLNKYLKGKTIVIDPGHGGIDNGATGSNMKTLEKTVNLQVSKIVVSKLEEAGANVVMTRTDDRRVSLQDRVDLAIRHKADAFISIHHNTHHDPRLNGTITYFYTDGDDRTLAQIIQREVVKRNGLRDLKARRGNYFVLRENPQLAVLVELGYLTNYQEELVINSNKFQENSAEGIFQGILHYFQQ